MENNLLNNLVVPLLSAALGGGGVLAYLKYFREGKKDSRTFDQTEADKYKEGFDTLSKQIDILNINYIPSNAPEWRKDSARRYVSVSPSFERDILLRVGLTRSDVLDRTDHDVFRKYPEYVKVIEDIENEVINSKEHIVIRNNVSFPEYNSQMMVVKEISQNVRGDTFYVGRAYPQKLIMCLSHIPPYEKN